MHLAQAYPLLILCSGLQPPQWKSRKLLRTLKWRPSFPRALQEISDRVDVVRLHTQLAAPSSVAIDCEYSIAPAGSSCRP